MEDDERVADRPRRVRPSTRTRRVVGDAQRANPPAVAGSHAGGIA